MTQEELQKMLDEIPEKKFAKYSDARLESYERHRNLMLTNNPNKGKVGALKGKTFSEEHKKKIGDAHRGKIVSKETLEKMSIANKGKKLSKETVEKMSKSMMGVNKGKKRSDEAKKRFSEIAKNRQFSDETRKKMSEKRKGRPVSDLAKQRALETNRRPILCYSFPDMIFICEYESITEASRILKKNRGGILKVLNGTIKEPRKYFFKYKD